MADFPSASLTGKQEPITLNFLCQGFKFQKKAGGTVLKKIQIKKYIKKEIGLKHEQVSRASPT